MNARSLATLLAVGFALGGAAHAATVEFAFRGSVSSVTDVHGVLDGSITVGGPLTGYARYDTALTDSTADPAIGFYAQPIPPGAFVVEVGSYTLELPAMQILIYDGFAFGGGPPVDSFDWRFDGATYSIPGAAGASLNSLFFVIDTHDTTTLPSDGLPPAPLDRADFEAGSFGIAGCLDIELSGALCMPSQTISFFGNITSVPEPRAAAAWAGANAALAWLCARRSLRPA